MKILVTFALEPEFAPWRRLRSFENIVGLPFTAFEAEAQGAQLRAVLTGMGPARAHRVAAAALAWRPDHCISSGFAGSLRPLHRVGEVIAAREVMELESGRTISSDADLLGRAQSLAVRVVDRLLSSGSLIATAHGKGRLGRMAEAIDMESFSVLSEAAARRIPAIAIRAISDDANESLPLDFDRLLDAQGRIAGSKLALAIARAPHKLPGLIRLGRNSRRAAIALTAFLDSYIQALTRNPTRSEEQAEAVRA